MPSVKGSPHAQFVDEIKCLMASTAAISEHLNILTSSFQTVVGTSPEVKQDLLDSSSRLSQKLGSGTKTLQDCLSDLATMGEAMTPVMESSPEAAPALLVNLYSTIFRQLRAYYRDSSDSFDKCSVMFERGRAAFYHEQFTSSTAAAAAAAAADSVTSMPNTPHRSPPSGSLGGQATGTGTATPPPVIEAPAKKKKRKNLMDDGLEDDTGTATEEPAAASSSAYATQQQQQEPSNFQDPRSDPFAAGTEAQMARRAKVRKAAEDREAPTDSRAYAPPQNEPRYLVVTSSVENALGGAVLAVRPNVFSSVDMFFRRPPTASYYVRLVRPGSMALFIEKNYVNLDPEMQADWFCDILDTDEVEVEPMVCPSGEVNIPDDQDLRRLPICAWWSGSNEDHSKVLHTTYTLAEWLPGLPGRTALIQDASVDGGQREEVLHCVSVIDATPQYAKVAVYTLGGRGGAGGPKSAAIASLMRNTFAKTGFTAVRESEAVSAVPEIRRDSSAMLAEIRTVLGGSQDVKASFNPGVELASLDDPSKGKSNLTMSDVTSGMLRGGLEVLRAPLTVGRAVMDVTGATGAIRNSVEGLFRKSFPHLEGQVILDTFNCSWQEGSIAKSGYLFVGLHWLCFAGSMANVQFAVEYDEIKDVQKSKSTVFNNALEFVTHLDEKFVLMSFVNRDQAFNLLMKQWLR